MVAIDLGGRAAERDGRARPDRRSRSRFRDRSTAPRTAASISARRLRRATSPGSSLRISDSVQRSGTAIKPPPVRPVIEQEGAADQSDARRAPRPRPNAPRAPTWTACAALQRIHAEFRHAEIGRVAGDLDVGDEEADLRGIDVEPGRLDIDGEIRLRRPRRPRCRATKSLMPARDAGARLAALLVADEGEGDVALEADAGLVEQRECRERGCRCRPSGRRRRGPRPRRRRPARRTGPRARCPPSARASRRHGRCRCGR